MHDGFFFRTSSIEAILYLGHLLTGFGMTLTAVVEGEYISLCATEKTKGFYFGYFLCIMQLSMVIGNYVGSVLILETTGPTFFLILGGIMLIGMVGFFFIITPNKK